MRMAGCLVPARPANSAPQAAEMGKKNVLNLLHFKHGTQ